MKKKLIKGLSAAITCMSIFSMPAMASTTDVKSTKATTSVSEIANATDNVTSESGFKVGKISKSPAKSISSFDIFSYGYNYGKNGWYASNVGTISKSNLSGLWCNTIQEGYGSLDYVKIDGTNVKYTYTQEAGSQSGNEVTGWIYKISITDSDYIRNLSSGSHTILISCSTRNTFPSRTLADRITFNVS